MLTILDTNSLDIDTLTYGKNCNWCQNFGRVPIFTLPSVILRPKIQTNHIIYLLLEELIINQPVRE